MSRRMLWARSGAKIRTATGKRQQGHLILVFLVLNSNGLLCQVWTDLVSEGWAEHCLEALEKVQLQGEEVVLPLVTGRHLMQKLPFEEI